jgi:hypothetical protein
MDQRLRAPIGVGAPRRLTVVVDDEDDRLLGAYEIVRRCWAPGHGAFS